MVIYLRHDIHGAKVAISEWEAVADEENGWERFDPEALVPQNETPNAVAAPRRGRPPKAKE